MTMDSIEIKAPLATLHNTTQLFFSVLQNTCITKKTHDSISLEFGIQEIIAVLAQCRKQDGVVYIVGNGGSAAIASHASIDFINMDKMRAFSLLDPAVITCISNDYGYEEIYAKQLSQFIKKEDVLIAISSSGKSSNITKAAEVTNTKDVKTITFSGFSESNPLRQLGDYNIWLNSNNYGQVEIGHAFILHYITDQLHYLLSENMV